MSRDYQPIDWQRDYKSGFRWDAKEPSAQQRGTLPNGADLKMPWELCRMQFLPQLATFAVASPDRREKILNEFKNIILDFIGANIPGYGVNWVCTMDVAIRATNILVAYDILKQLDQKDILSGEFKSILQKSISEHGWFIINNLEYSEIITSNHYLSNICGLLFISAYLEENKHTNAWLAFSIQEILSEFPKQFYKDGGNFEASTSYHRLSSEMLIYSFTIMKQVVKIKKEVFKKPERIEWYIKPKLNWSQIEKLPYKVRDEKLYNHLYKTGKFTYDILKQNGEIPQFGDNDSGRFLKFSPVGSFVTNEQAEKKYHNLRGYNTIVKNKKGLYFDENILDHKALLAAYSGFFSDENLREYGEEFPLEKSIISSLAGERKCINLPGKVFSIKSKTVPAKKFTHKKTFTYKLNQPIDLGSLETALYPDFGIYILKSGKDDFYLAVFFGENGQNGLGGHSHNDKLSFELYHQGKNLFIDPGTYLYTPFPQIRNKFRSVFAHNCPIHNNQETDDFKEGRKGVFRLFNNHKCSVLSTSGNHISLLLEYKKVKHIREFKIEATQLIINDYSNTQFEQNFFSGDKFSNGYGKLTKFETTNQEQ